MDRTSPRERRFSGLALSLGLGAWILTVGAGMGALYQYSFAEGQPANPPATWPADSMLELSPDRPTLLMVAHPHCSCTRASIGELAELLAQIQGRVRGYVLFIKPADFDGAWEHTDLYESALLLPDTTVVTDVDGREAARFGALTSGQTYLYGADGALLFRGGITPTRSHMGDNVGSQRIASLVLEGRAERDRSAVYGCALSDEESDHFVLSGLRFLDSPDREKKDN